jgi:hypothetical protein
MVESMDVQIALSMKFFYLTQLSAFGLKAIEFTLIFLCFKGTSTEAYGCFPRVLLDS